MSSVAYAMSDADLLTPPAGDPGESAWEHQPPEVVVEWRVVAQGKNRRVEVTFPQAPPRWTTEAMSDLVELLELPEGWNSYRARRVDFDAVKCAIEVLFGIVDRQAPRPAIVPTARGGVQIEWHGANDVEVEIFPNGSVGFLSGEHELDFDHWTVAIPEIRRELQGLVR